MERQFRQVTCSKTVSGAEFAKGLQRYEFHVDNTSRWVPSKSFFRVEYTITASDLTGAVDLDVPKSNQYTAPAELMPSILYESAACVAGGSTISQIMSNVPQAAMLRARLHKSAAWQKTSGKVFGLEPSLQKRIGWVSQDADLVNEEKLERVPLLSDTTQAGQLDLVAATGTLTASNAASFADVRVGDIVVVQRASPGASNGPGPAIPGQEQRYRILAITDDFNCTVERCDGVALVDFAEITNFYGLKRTNGSGKNVSSVMFQPPIGLFYAADVNDNPARLYGGTFRLDLQPNTNFAQAVESLQTDSSRFAITIQDVQFWACIERDFAPSEQKGIVQRLTLHEQRFSPVTLNNLTGTYNFTVPSSTQQLSLFVIDEKSGSNNAFPATKFVVEGNEERSLKSVQITKDGISKPANKYDTTSGDFQDYLRQRYLETQIESGMMFESAGCESYEDWLERGVLLHYDFTSDSSMRGTNVQVQLTMGTKTGNPIMYLCAWADSTVSIVSSYGVIESVERQDI
jgi:hypothetical protein